MTIFIPAPAATALLNSGPVELRMQVRMTRAFIQADPSSLVFNRNKREQDATGGWITVPEFAVEEQVGKVCEISGGRGIENPRIAADGKQRTADFLLVMEVGADVEIDDWFMLNEKKWSVIEVGRSLGYEVRLLVAQYG